MEQNKIDVADYLQRFSAKVLWHFTGYNKSQEQAFAYLVSIARNCLLKISNRSFTVKMPNGEKRYGFPASCTCDIPFKDLRLHISRYNQFGIAFHRKNAIEEGRFNPVLYMHKDHIFFKHADSILPQLEYLASTDSSLKKVLSDYLLMIGTYVKRGDLTSDIYFNPLIDEEQNNNFYYEREWRSAYDWYFKKDDVGTVMMPLNYITKFKEAIKGTRGEEVFRDLPFISSELVNVL